MLVNRLLNTLLTYDFSEVREDVLKELYQGLVDPTDRHDLGEFYTPDWLAELILRDELGLDQDPHRSLLDPACGSGTFLFIAVRLIRQALEREGMTATDILLHILNNVVGMDVHPLAVAISRTNYLLALGDLLQARRREVTIPVYLADAMKLPEPQFGMEVEPNVLLQLPQSLATDPTALDYVLNYMKGQYGQNALRFIALNPQVKERNLNAFREFLIAPGNSRKQAVLQPEEAEVLVRTQDVLLRLMQEGKDTLWFFILRNSLRPLYFGRRRFDLVAGNPPWLSLRYVRSPVYTRWLRTQIVQEYQLIDRPGRGTTYLYSQMEMATLFFARAADLYLKQSGHIAFVMPRSVMGSGQQHARFTGMSFKRGGLLQLGLQKALDLEGVSPLFMVPACVLVAEKGKWPEYPVDGAVVAGELPFKNAPLEQARRSLTFRPVQYQRVEGRLTATGQDGEGAQAPRGRSYYYARFNQGAILVPRNLWFVRPVVTALGGSQYEPFFETDPEAITQAKAPWKNIHMEGNVEARFMYATLPSGQLVPFGHTRLSPVILPLVVEGERYTLLNADGAQERGFHRLAEWLTNAEEHWQTKAKRSDGGSLKAPSIVARLDYLHNLTRQSPTLRYRVLYVKSATLLCATVVDARSNLSVPLPQGSLPLAGFLADHEAYLYETDDASEANYLQSVFNSDVLNLLIKPLQTRGQWGERDIHKRPLQFLIPQYDAQSAVHVRLAELGQACAAQVAEATPELAARYRSIGRLRGEVRRLLARELAEIDALTRQALGLG
ncbi:MAG: N-6 DNA methylase [Chloroflexi bacterium]|nr:N-6 DNA methylase [Chloroflexota bacterium]